MKRYRCVVIDDEADVRKRICNLAEKTGRLEVVAAEGSAAAAVRAVVEHKPDIVFMDIEMPGKNGFDLITELRNQFCHPKFIIVTAYNQYAIKAIKAAAFDFLLKPVDIVELTETVRRFEELTERVAVDVSQPCFSCLTQREKEIVVLLRRGQSSRDIAEELFLSKHTVDTHRRNILQKLGMTSTMELLRTEV